MTEQPFNQSDSSDWDESLSESESDCSGYSSSLLPDEILSTIFLFLIHSSPTSTSLTSPNEYSHSLHLPSLLSLSLVSRLYHSLSSVWLYSTILISNPTTLIKLHKALISRPTLGLLVKNLWIGDLKVPKDRGLPHWVGSLRDWKNGDEEFRKSWKVLYQVDQVQCENDDDLSENVERKSKGKGKGKGREKKRRPKGKGPSLFTPGLDSDDQNIGTDEWVLRVWEVEFGKTVLIQEQLQEELASSSSLSSPSPIFHSRPLPLPSIPSDASINPSNLPITPLASTSITHTSTTPKPSPSFHTRLLSYISSPNLPSSNSFSHPILYARSSLSNLILGPSLIPDPFLTTSLPQTSDTFFGFGNTESRGGRRVGVADVPISSRGGGWTARGDGNSWRGSGESGKGEGTREREREGEGLHTIGSLATIVRSLIGMCPNLENLALNGWLEMCVGDERSCSGLPNL